MSKVICYYLPQYHEFYENNLWWGKGFTEWTCVKNAKSYHANHIIKHPHKDIGYYCLDEKNTRKWQADIAHKYKIYGFCYYHYWFGNKILMQRPLEKMLQDGEPNIPFCLCWANEPWTRQMNGGSGEILQPCKHGGEKEWKSHFEYLLKYFKHPNYIKIRNKPVFLIYRISQIPNFQERKLFFNHLATNHGFDGIFTVLTLGNFPDDFNLLSKDVDACVEFFPNFFRKSNTYISIDENNRAFYDMEKSYQIIDVFPKYHEIQFKGTMCGFDSSSRNTNRSNIFINGNPKMFEESLKKQLTKTDYFVFINAWNEWGEGACLEPDTLFGYEYLEATKKAIKKSSIK